MGALWLLFTVSTMLGIYYINIDISCVVVGILTPQTTLTAQWDSADDAAVVLEKVSCCE